MKKYKIMKGIAIGIFVLFIINIIIDIVSCMFLEYPHDALGVTVWKWTEQFGIDFWFLLIYWIVPLVIALILLVISIIKMKKLNSK